MALVGRRSKVRIRCVLAALAVIALSLTCSAAGADGLFTFHSRTIDARAGLSNFHRVVVIGKDNRQTLTEYAKAKHILLLDINRKFSPTGLFSCEGQWATGQLTGANNIVTTASHVFHDKNCKKYQSVKHCFFKPVNSKRRCSVDLSSLIFGCDPDFIDKDWAVAKLDRPVENTNFYDVPLPYIVIPEHQPITQVSYLHKNFKQKGNYPPTAQDCMVRAEQRATYLHDCDTGGGSSGSAQLIGNTLVGINVGECVCDDNRSEFSEKYWNIGVPLRGEFLSSIKKLLGE